MEIRIAILTGNDFSVIGGAEKHIMDTARALDADIICPHFNNEVIGQYDPNNTIRFLSLGKKLPQEPLKQICGKWLFNRLNLDYEFYIVMDDMAVQYLKKGQHHLYYLFTPRRALYDMYYLFLEDLGILKGLFYRIIFKTVSIYDRYFVKKYVRHFASNSHNVRNRIYKVYQREAVVLYPPVHTERYTHRPSEGFWLSIGRVDKWKRIELQIDAFRRMPDKKLIVAGPIYPNYKLVVENAPQNVQFLGTVSEETLLDLYSRCEGLLATAIDEDFGLTPVEAMASGKPVVATKEGGYLESVVDGFTGLLVAPNQDEICSAITKISKDAKYYREFCEKRAKLFDYSIFKKNIEGQIRAIVSEYSEEYCPKKRNHLTPVNK